MYTLEQVEELVQSYFTEVSAVKTTCSQCTYLGRITVEQDNIAFKLQVNPNNISLAAAAVKNKLTCKAGMFYDLETLGSFIEMLKKC